MPPSLALPRSRAARIATLGYGALALTDTALAASPSPEARRLRWVTKPLLMPMLGTAFSASLAGRGVHRGGILRGGAVAGQALSGVGDIALLGGGRAAFLAGLGSFLGAHTAYTVAFSSAGRRLGDRGGIGGTLAAAGLGAALGPAMSRAAGRQAEVLRTPVLAYTAALSATVAAATRLDHRVPRRARRVVVGGASLFLASDALLGARQFLVEDPSPWWDAAVMLTYTAGQGLIALGVSQAVASLDAA